MSDHEKASSSTAQPAAATPAVPYNFPLPAPVKLSGDVYQNFKFFRMQWEDYEVATQLTEKPDSIRMATLRSVMGQNCLQIYQHLHISDADKSKVKPSRIGETFRTLNQCCVRALCIWQCKSRRE